MTPPDIIYSDIALQYLFRIFSLFRVFSQSHSHAEMILYREKPRKTQTYARRLSHFNHRKHRNLHYEHGFRGFRGFLILRPQYPFCGFRDF